MNTGVWVWPSEPRRQRKTLRMVAASPSLMIAMNAIAKKQDGMSNSELDEALGDNAEWITIWTIRQLTSLGFVDYKVDLFGGPAKYQITDLGRNAISMITGQPAPRPPPVVQAPPPKPATAPAPTPAPQAAVPKPS